MAFNLSFARTFQHEDWVDNVDRVQAAGENGFNQRFHGIEADLDAVSGVVDQAEAALNQLGQAPPPQTHRVSLTPMLMATSGVGWEHRNGFVQKLSGQTAASGMQSVQLPDGARILRMRVLGRNSGAGSLRVTLFRQGVDPTATVEQVARVEVDADPYDNAGQAAANTAVVDNEAYRYFVVAALNSAGATDTVSLTTFQVVHETA